MKTFRSILLAAGLVLPVAGSAQSLSSSNTDTGIPANAVIGFVTACPDGYTELTSAAGRAIVGAGAYSESFRGNTYSANYSLGDIGGNAAYKLATSEMPRHNHGTNKSLTGGYRSGMPRSGANISCSSRDSTCGRNEFQTDYQGGSVAFDNRQPYIVLNLCRKL